MSAIRMPDTICGFKIHPAAEFFDAMPADEFDALQESIKKNGLIVPLTLSEGKLLSGRHRGLACDRLGITPTTINLEDAFPGMDAGDYSIAENLDRRHLTPSQRAMSAARFLAYHREKAAERKKAGAAAGMEAAKKGGKRKKKGEEESEVAPDVVVEGADFETTTEAAKEEPRVKPVRAEDEAGKRFTVSGDSVLRAEKVLKSCSAEVQRLVRDGDLTIRAAESKLVPLPKKLQTTVAKLVGGGASLKDALAEVVRTSTPEGERAARVILDPANCPSDKPMLVSQAFAYQNMAKLAKEIRGNLAGFASAHGSELLSKVCVYKDSKAQHEGLNQFIIDVEKVAPFCCTCPECDERINPSASKDKCWLCDDRGWLTREEFEALEETQRQALRLGRPLTDEEKGMPKAEEAGAAPEGDEVPAGVAVAEDAGADLDDDSEPYQAGY